MITYCIHSSKKWSTINRLSHQRTVNVCCLLEALLCYYTGDLGYKNLRLFCFILKRKEKLSFFTPDFCCSDFIFVCLASRTTVNNELSYRIPTQVSVSPRIQKFRITNYRLIDSGSKNAFFSHALLVGSLSQALFFLCFVCLAHSHNFKPLFIVLLQCSDGDNAIKLYFFFLICLFL